MVEIDPITGLPKDLGVWDELVREDQQITVKIDKRRFGKEYTVISGFESSFDVKELSKTLKNKFACGGTGKNGQIELQGNHLGEISKVLVQQGFPAETINVKKR